MLRLASSLVDALVLTEAFESFFVVGVDRRGFNILISRTILNIDETLGKDLHEVDSNE